LRCKEKIHEDLISESEAKMAYKIGEYFHISTVMQDGTVHSFNSSMNLVDIEILEKYLLFKDLL